MSWFFVDDGFYDHPKLALLPPKLATASVGLWVLAGSWSRRKLTGGEIPRGQVGRLGGSQREAAALVAAGLWEETADGYQFHEWAHWQETPEEVEHKRQKGKERAQRWRDNRRARNGVTPSERDRHERRSSAASTPSVPGSPSPSPSPSPFPPASREGERARARGSQEEPELEDGQPELSEAETLPLHVLVRKRFNHAYAARRGNPPAWPSQSVKHCIALASWLEPLGRTGAEYELLLKRLLANFFADTRMADKGYPIAFLVPDAEKFLNPPVQQGKAARRRGDPEGFSPPAPAESFTGEERSMEEIFGPRKSNPTKVSHGR